MCEPLPAAAQCDQPTQTRHEQCRGRIIYKSASALETPRPIFHE